MDGGLRIRDAISALLGAGLAAVVATTLTATTLTATTATVSTLAATNATSTNFDATVGRITGLTAASATLTATTMTNATTSNLDVSTIIRGPGATMSKGVTTSTQDFSALRTCQAWKATNGTVYYIYFNAVTMDLATSTSACSS